MADNWRWCMNHGWWDWKSVTACPKCKPVKTDIVSPGSGPLRITRYVVLEREYSMDNYDMVQP
jgi:hypothetical protein